MTIRGLVLFLFALTIMLVSGGAFANKMIEFVFTMSGDEVAGFGATAVATYLAGMLPLLLLTLWAAFTGRFRDIERPASRMLELHDAIDREEAQRGR